MPQKGNPFGTCEKDKEFLNNGISKGQTLRIEYFSIFRFYSKTCAFSVLAFIAILQNCCYTAQFNQKSGKEISVDVNYLNKIT
jgi:hypothetical protein